MISIIIDHKEFVTLGPYHYLLSVSICSKTSLHAVDDHKYHSGC